MSVISDSKMIILLVVEAKTRYTECLLQEVKHPSFLFVHSENSQYLNYKILIFSVPGAQKCLKLKNQSPAYKNFLP